MNAAADLGWLWTGLAWTLSIAGVVVLLLALFRDRARGRRRCPKCWYEMTGVPGLVCPECGRDAKRERRLHKRRPSKRMALVACALIAMAYGGVATPRVLRSGWRGAVPTTGLVLAQAVISPENDTTLFRRTRVPSTVAGALFDELRSNRLGRLWRWQRWLLAEVCSSGKSGAPVGSPGWQRTRGAILDWLAVLDPGAVQPQLIRVLSHTRATVILADRWPTGVPVVVQVDVRAPMDRMALRYGLRDRQGVLRVEEYLRPPTYHESRWLSPWNDRVILVPGATEATEGLEMRESLEFSIGVTEWVTVFERPINLKCSIQGDVGDFVTPDPAPRLTAALQDRLKPTLLIRNGAGTLLLGPQWPLSGLAFQANRLVDRRMTFAVRATILRDDIVVAEPGAWWPLDPQVKRSPPLASGSEFIEIPRMRGVTRASPGAEEHWALRLTGDPVMALRDPGRGVYWDGEVTLPLTVRWRDEAVGSR